jgi:hypothetical protein
MAIIAHGFGPRHMHPTTTKLFKRWWFWLIIAVMFVLLAAAAWIGVRALGAKSELEAAQAQVSQLKADAVAQKFSSLGTTMAKIESHAAKARDLTSDPIWRLAELIPVAGKNLTVVRQLAAATDAVVVDAVAPLVKVASTLSPKSFAPVDGAINLAPLTAAVPAVAQAKAGINSAVATIDGIDTSGTVGVLVAAKQKLSGLLTSVVPLIDTANEALPFIAPAMGSQQPRHYAVMFENNAESRPLGGTALSFALITMDHGKITLASTVSAGSSHFASYASSVIPVPDGLMTLYDGRNSPPRRRSPTKCGSDSSEWRWTASSPSTRWRSATSCEQRRPSPSPRATSSRATRSCRCCSTASTFAITRETMRPTRRPSS